MLLNCVMTAKEVVDCGYANGIIDGLEEMEWPDIEKIPAIMKLLATDYKTLVNAKTLINKAKDQEKINDIIQIEAKANMDMLRSTNIEVLYKYQKQYKKLAPKL